jgi:endoglucanase
MMKTSFYFVFIFCTALSAPAQSKFIHRDGKTLVDSTGKEIKLRGVNLGGWLLWEEWIWGGGFHSQTSILKDLKSIAGEEETNKFEEGIYQNFITEADIKQIAVAKFNVVRIPFNHRILGSDPTTNKIGWKILDNVVGWCKKYGVYAVIDMHSAPGGQSPYFIADPEKTNLWKVRSYWQYTADLWREIANRYKNNTAVAGFDLLNEPIPGDTKKLLELYTLIIGEIRKADQNHALFIEGANFAKKFNMFDKLPDENMAFEFHLYTWLGGDPAKKIAPFINLRNKLNVPVWCGEWGENKTEVLKQTKDVYESVAFAGWCMWTWKKVPNNYPALCEIKPGLAWTKLILHLNKPKKNPAPSKEEAIQGMHEFLEAVKFTNCKMHDEVLNVLQH